MAVHVGALEAANIYVGATPAAGVYLGAEKVWPTAPKRVYTETFPYANEENTWGPLFSKLTNGANMNLWSSRAGIENRGNGISEGVFTHADLSTDGHYCDVSLLSAIERADHANQPCCIQLRRAPDGADPFVEFQLKSNNAAIYTRIGSAYASRISAAATIAAGQTIRLVTRGDGYNAAYNLTTDPGLTAPLVQWSDAARELRYEPGYRAMGMKQHATYALGLNNQCFSVDTLTYGDL